MHQLLSCPNAVRFAATRPSLKEIAGGFANRLLEHPFLRRCADGTITRKELDHLVIQQGKYSQYFTRFLCALISQLEDNADVLRLAENLSEELGYGSDARIPHSRIYSEMLGKLGLDLRDEPMLPETQALIDCMFMLCRQPRGIAGLGAMCLGAEAVVPSLYARIVQGFLTHGVCQEYLHFFTIHIECDDDHAQTMYDMLSDRISQSGTNFVTAMQAGEMAINARMRLFDALAQCGPVSQSDAVLQ